MSRRFDERLGVGIVRRGAWLLVLATVLWAGNYVAGRALAPVMSAFLLNGIRWTISAILLVVIMRWRGKIIPLRARWREFGLLGLVGMFAFSSLNYLGLHTVSATQAGMIAGTMPVAILLMSVLLLHERPAGWAWTGMAVSVAGVAVLVFAGHQSHWTFSVGDLELISASLAWGLYTVLGKRFGRHMDALTMTAGAAVYGAIPSLLAGLLLPSAHTEPMTTVGWAALLYVSTAASVLAYFAWTAGVERVGASRSAPYINLLPLWTVLLGVWLLGEHVVLLSLFGGALTVIGALLAGRRGKGNGR